MNRQKMPHHAEKNTVETISAATPDAASNIINMDTTTITSTESKYSSGILQDFANMNLVAPKYSGHINAKRPGAITRHCGAQHCNEFNTFRGYNITVPSRLTGVVCPTRIIGHSDVGDRDVTMLDETRELFIKLSTDANFVEKLRKRFDHISPGNAMPIAPFSVMFRGALYRYSGFVSPWVSGVALSELNIELMPTAEKAAVFAQIIKLMDRLIFSQDQMLTTRCQSTIMNELLYDETNNTVSFKTPRLLANRPTESNPLLHFGEILLLISSAFSRKD